MNISAALDRAAEILAEAGVAEARREASSLLAFVLEKEATFLIAHPEYQLTEIETTRYDEAVRRRAGREPFQYITGRQEFFGLEFEVNSDVLIPRPETEILVEEAIAILSGRTNPSFLEIGVGSGCISIAILSSVTGAGAVGVDMSQAALSVAARNAERHNAAAALELRQADLFEGLSGAFDLIVSNPPYVPDDQLAALQTEVRSFEPHTALSGGGDGLSIIRRIARGAPQFLVAGCFLLMEIGFDQAIRAGALFDPRIWESVEFLPDLQGIPRIVKARVRT